MEHYREPKAEQPLSSENTFSHESSMLHEHVQTVVYTGGDWMFAPEDGVVVILTHLESKDFSHLETHADRVDLIILKGRSQNRMRFREDALQQVILTLADGSELDVDLLDEHIVLTE